MDLIIIWTDFLIYSYSINISNSAVQLWNIHITPQIEKQMAFPFGVVNFANYWTFWIFGSSMVTFRAELILQIKLNSALLLYSLLLELRSRFGREFFSFITMVKTEYKLNITLKGFIISSGTPTIQYCQSIGN